MLSERAHNSRGVLPWKFDKHRKAAVALDGCDVRVVRSGKKVSFPMARNGTILGLGGRSRIETISIFVPVILLAAFGAAHLRRVRNCAVSFFFSTPRV